MLIIRKYVIKHIMLHSYVLEQGLTRPDVSCVFGSFDRENEQTKFPLGDIFRAKPFFLSLKLLTRTKGGFPLGGIFRISFVHIQ